MDEAQLSPAASNGSNGSNGAGPKKALQVKVPKWCGKWVVGMDDYADGVVGAKSKNIAGGFRLCAGTSRAEVQTGVHAECGLVATWSLAIKC